MVAARTQRSHWSPCAPLEFAAVASSMASGPFTSATVPQPCSLSQGGNSIAVVALVTVVVHGPVCAAQAPQCGDRTRLDDFGTAEFTGDAGGPPGADDVDSTSLMASVEHSSLMQHSAIWPGQHPRQ